MMTSDLRTKAGRWAVVIAAVLSCTFMAYLWIDGWAANMLKAMRLGSPTTHMYATVLLETFVGIIAAGIALAIAARAWDRRPARALSVFLLTIALFYSGGGLARVLGDLGYRSVSLEAQLSTIILACMCVAVVRFSALTGVPGLREERGKSWRAQVYQWSARPGLVWSAGTVAAVLMSIEAQFLTPNRGPILTELLIAASTFVAVSNLALVSSTAVAAERRALWWVWAGLLFAFIGITLRAALGILEPQFGLWASRGKFYAYLFGQIGLLGCLALAIFHRGALDPRLVVRRTALSGGTAAAMLFVFVVVENALADIVAARVGIPAGFAGWIAGATAGIGFAPLHKAIRRLLDRYSLNGQS